MHSYLMRRKLFHQGRQVQGKTFKTKQSLLGTHAISKQNQVGLQLSFTAA